MKPLSALVLVAMSSSVAAHEEVVFDFDFERYDVDNSGFLSELEWEEATFVTVPFEKADTDNNGRIDREEALEIAKRGI